MIRLQNICKAYGALTVIERLSMTIPSGEITVLIGPSGCGKTTLLEMINGLIPPDRGNIFIGEQNLREIDGISLRRRIGYVIQEVGLFPHYTVYDNIALVPRLLRWDEARIRNRVNELIELVNIPTDRLEKYPSQLSGGQQQRVGVARALAANPDYLLMDEPFSAIDPINRERLQDEFLRIQANLGKTVVFVTHDMNEAMKIGDRIAIINKGKVIQYDTPLQLLKSPADPFVKEFVGRHRHFKALQFMTVKDLLPLDSPVMTWGAPTAPSAEIARAMEQFQSDYILFVNRENRYLGFVCREDLTEDEVKLRSEAAPVTIATDLQEALERLLASPLSALPVVDENRQLKGCLTLTDFNKTGINRNPKIHLKSKP